MVSRKRDRADPVFPEFSIQIPDKGQDPLFHFAEVSLVWGFVYNLPFTVYDYTIQAHGSCINARVELIRILN
jgi:hypothetical protein